MAEQTGTQGAAAPAKDLPKFQAPKKRKWPKRLVTGVVLAAAAVFLLQTFGGGGTGAASGTYSPAPAEKRDMAITVTGSGTIKPNDTYRATTLVKGEILSAPFEEGQTVRKDDVLFTIDASSVESAIKQAVIGVEQAQLALQTAQLNYDSLLRTRSENAADRQVKANATGVIEALHVDPGDNVAVGTPIADILDRDNMKLEVPFHSVDAAGFYVGQSASVAVSGTAEVLPGVISEIAATDTVGAGGALVRKVTITVSNPGALSDNSMGSASVGAVSSAASASFTYGARKQLVAKYTGELETLSIKEGDRVTDGQLVGQFKETDMQDQINAAAISVQNAKLSLKTAQDNLERTQDTLEDYTITSPIDGTVIEKNYKAGDNIDPANTSSEASAFMAVIYDMSRLTFDMAVDELDVAKLKVGQAVTFTTNALKGQTFTGKVEKVNINGTTVNGFTTYPVTVAVDGDGGALAQRGLFSGMNISASILVDQATGALTVPVNAVSRDNTVLVAGEGALDEAGNLADPSKLEPRSVEIGRSDEFYVEILSGLAEGEIVFTQDAVLG